MKTQTIEMMCPCCDATTFCTKTNHGLKYPEDWVEIAVHTQDPLHEDKTVKRPVYVCPACNAKLENGEELQPTAEFHNRVEMYNAFIKDTITELLKG